MGLALGTEADRRFHFAGAADDHGLTALAFVQGVEHAQNAAGLVEEAVAVAVAIGAVAIIHGAAESRVRFGVAVAADRQVMAGEDPGELADYWSDRRRCRRRSC